MPKHSPVMYIVARRDLNMPAGKLAAQAGHAAIRCFYKNMQTEGNQLWEDYMNVDKGNEAKIVLGVDTLKELEDLEHTCWTNGIKTAMVKDAGLTVFKEPTVTCMAIGPVTAEKAELFRSLKLY